MPTHEEAVKAQQAEQILTSDVFQEVMENLKQEYIDAWLSSNKSSDVDVRENLHKAILLKKSRKKQKTNCFIHQNTYQR